MLVNKTALFLGRFQPVSIAHASMVESILTRYERLIVLVLFDTPESPPNDPRWNEYLRDESGKDFSPNKNPFTPVEVKKMWDAYIKFKKISRRARVRISKRVFFDANFDNKFPKEKFDIVASTPFEKDSNKDLKRSKLFCKLLARPYIFITPPFKLHISTIKQIVSKSEGMNWELFIPNGAYQAFLEIGGPKRLERSVSVESNYI